MELEVSFILESLVSEYICIYIYIYIFFMSGLPQLEN